MDFKKEEDRIYAEDEHGHLLAEITFPRNGNKRIINHTYVHESLRGQGVAGKLMEMTIQELHNKGEAYDATCSYAIVWLQNHPQKKEE